MIRNTGAVMLAVWLLVWLSSSASAASRGEALFDRCRASTGESYVAARDAWLSAGASLPASEATRSADWRTRSTRLMLEAWRAHSETYRRYTAPSSRSDQLDRPDLILLGRPSLVPVEAMPLLYEFILKRTVPDSVRLRAARALVYRHRHGRPVDVGLLRAALLDSAGGDDAGRNILAGLLAALPADAFGASEFRALLGAELGRAQPHKPTAIALLDGLVARGVRLAREERDALSESVVSMQGLRGLLGPLRFTHAIGDIGATRGVAFAAGFLERALIPAQQRWAIDALGRASSRRAAEHLLAFAESSARPVYLRRRALLRLRDCDQGPTVAEAISALEDELR